MSCMCIYIIKHSIFENNISVINSYKKQMPAFRIKLVIIYAFLQIELTTTEKSTTTFLLHYRIKNNEICIFIFLLFLLTLIWVIITTNLKTISYIYKKGGHFHISYLFKKKMNNTKASGVLISMSICYQSVLTSKNKSYPHSIKYKFIYSKCPIFNYDMVYSCRQTARRKKNNKN